MHCRTVSWLGQCLVMTRMELESEVFENWKPFFRVEEYLKEKPFIPSFCPNPECEYHQNKIPINFPWYMKRGWYHSSAHGKVQRYLCKSCGKSFSERMFFTDYYAKRIDIDLQDLLFHYSNGFSQRALADHYHCTTRTIAQKLQTISRQAMSAIIKANSYLHTREDIAIDGMQNFTGSQYQPNNYNISVGQYSQYISMVTQVIFRRAGKMNAYQKRRREYFDAVGLWKRGAFTKSIRELVTHLSHLVEQRDRSKTTIICNSDDKKMYAREIRRNQSLRREIAANRFSHMITSSKCWRDHRNPLFPVNYIDGRLRNDLADWQRETTSFPREANRNFQRFLCYIAYHNFFKPHRIRTPDTSHAEAAGIPRKIVQEIRKDFFQRRAFYSLTPLPPQWNDCWNCVLVTPLQVHRKIPFNGSRKPNYLQL